MIVRLVTVRTVTVLVTLTVRVMLVVAAAGPSGTRSRAATSVVLKSAVLMRIVLMRAMFNAMSRSCLSAQTTPVWRPRSKTGRLAASSAAGWLGELDDVAEVRVERHGDLRAHPPPGRLSRRAVAGHRHFGEAKLGKLAGD